MNDSRRTTVFVAYGSFGDIYPLLAVARAMQDAGHRVVFVANEYFEPAIRRAGVPYEQAGTREEQLAARETASSSGDTFEGAMVRYDNIIGHNYARLAAIIRRRYDAGEELLVVTHGYMSPAIPVCEELWIPVVITYLAPSQIPDNREDYVMFHTQFGERDWFVRNIRYPLHMVKSLVHHNVYPRYNRWRRRAGFKPVQTPLVTALRNLLRGKGLQRRANHFCTVGELALFPEWFAEPVGDEIRDIQFLDFVFHTDDDERNNGIVDEFVARHGAPVVFTPGTAVEDITSFCAAVGDTCKLLGAPAIVLSRYVREQLAQFDFEKSGAAVLALDHVDLGYLLPKARLLVHHGGIGTLAQAVRAGIPQIIRPRMYDQPMNAIRVAMNGVGGMLYNDAYQGSEIADVYRHIVGSELHRERLEYYGNLVRSGDGARQAAELIARHAATARLPGRGDAPLHALAAGATE